jgi:hypothetical protein
MLPTKFRFIWPSGFRGEDFLEINQSETRIVCGGHVCKWIGTYHAYPLQQSSANHHWHLVPIHLQTWPPQTILVSDWLISKKSSPLKPLGQVPGCHAEIYIPLNVLPWMYNATDFTNFVQSSRKQRMKSSILFPLPTILYYRCAFFIIVHSRCTACRHWQCILLFSM